MRVQLLATCLVDSLFPEIGEATVEVLAKAGARPSFPPSQTCCGQPLLNAGYPAEAHHRSFFGGSPGRRSFWFLHRRHRYPELFADDPRLLRRAFELSEFLIDQLMVADLEAPTAQVIAYQPACHLLRGLGINRQPIELLQAIPGNSVERLEPECCGFGGVFSVDHALISKEMLKRMIRQIEDTGAETVVGCDANCLMQIEGGLRRAGSNIRCSHLSQTLTGREPGLR